WAADDRLPPDVLAQAADAGPGPADAADGELGPHAGPAGGVERVDHVGLDDRVHLRPDLGGTPGARVLRLDRDEFQQARLQRDGRDGDVFQLLGLDVAREGVERLRRLAPERG